MKPPDALTPYPALRPKKRWFVRWWAIALWVFLGLAVIGSFLPDEGPNEATATDTSSSETTEPEAETSESPAEDDETESASEASEAGESAEASDQKTQAKEPSPTPKQSKSPKPKPSPPANPNRHTAVVARVIDGDTVELRNGQSVRVVGIDTPERGECHYETASNRMTQLVEGKTVRLTRADEDTDRYGRLLRYINVGDIDPGLRLIKEGVAIARYDSRDGYGYHPREPIYIRIDNATPQRTCAPPPAPEPEPEPEPQQPAGDCEPGYDPCVPAFPPDLDCADVNGPIQVTGSDPHGLDRDGDGFGCE